MSEKINPKTLDALQQELNPYISCKTFDFTQPDEEKASLRDKNDNLEPLNPPLAPQYCRTCLQHTETYFDVNASNHLVELLKTLISDINLGLTKDPVVCQKCFNHLEMCNNFLKECKRVEDELHSFCMQNERFEISLDEYFTSVKPENEDLDNVSDFEVKSESGSVDLEPQKPPKRVQKRRSKRKTSDLANSSVQCETCNQKFTSKWALDRHRPVHNKKNSKFFCKECNLKFKYKYSYEKHLEAHNSLGGQVNKPFGCACGKSFNRRAKLLKHQEIHVKKDRPFGCQSCGKRFLEQQILNAHIDRVHISEKPFSCELCGNKYTSKAGLDVHIKSHFREENPKPNPDLMCDVCGKLFFRKYGLEKHRMSHTGHKPHKCEECGMAFKERYQLTIHTRRHTGEKPFKCEICNFKFPSKNSLAVHTRIHTGVRPFPCQICDMAFTRNDHLVKHVRAIHTGERPFECDICKKTFNRKDYLLKHKRVHVTRGANKVVGEGLENRI